MKESFKKDILAITCGIIVGCVLIHHSGWQIASWLMWVIGIIGGGVSAYTLRLAFEPARAKNAASHSWQKVKQMELRWPKIKWGPNKETTLGVAKAIVIFAGGTSWFLVLLTLTRPLDFNLLVIPIILGHLIPFISFVLIGLTSSETDDLQTANTSTALKWNTVVMPFSLIYYVGYVFLFKMVMLNILKFGCKFFVSFAKFVHHSTGTACAVYATTFTVVVAIITNDILAIIILAIVGGLIGALMRRLVPKWCHWEYPQVANV